MAIFVSCSQRPHNESGRVPQELSQINRTSTNERKPRADANRREIAVVLHILLESSGARRSGAESSASKWARNVTVGVCVNNCANSDI